MKQFYSKSAQMGHENKWAGKLRYWLFRCLASQYHFNKPENAFDHLIPFLLQGKIYIMGHENRWGGKLRYHRLFRCSASQYHFIFTGDKINTFL